jgi:hypothetical protein
MQPLEYDDRSLEDEEAKAAFLDTDDDSQIEELTARRTPTPRKKRHPFVLPCSLATNAIFFVAVLFLLSHPCYFSARTCIYKTDERPVGLLGELNRIVPECK